MSKTVKIVIASSFLLNVLLIGIVIGSLSHRFFRPGFHGGPPPPPGPMAKLPPDREKVFMDALEKVKLENREVYRKIDEGRERVLSILRAPVFDEAAYQAETAAIDRLRGMLMQRFAEATKELAKQFNQEERKILAEYLRQPPPPPPHRGGPMPKPGPPP